MGHDSEPAVDRGMRVARTLWKEAGEAFRLGTGGQNHPNLVRALANAGVPVRDFPDTQLPSELRWHPNALILSTDEVSDINNVLKVEIPGDDLDTFLANLGKSETPTIVHAGREYKLIITADKTKLEVRSPAMLARIRSPIIPSHLQPGKNTRDNPTQGVCVYPVTSEFKFRSPVTWGRDDQGRACWLSNQFHRGLVVLAPELLDAIALQACTGFACWWLPKSPGVDADPIPHDYYASRQITRAIVAYPVKLKADFMDDGMNWFKRMLEIQPALRVTVITPTAEEFPTLVKPAPPEVEKDMSVRYVPADSSLAQVTWLHALRQGGRDRVRKAVFFTLKLTPQADVVVEPALDARPEIMGGPIEWARRFLYDRFLEEGDSRWRLVRIMGTWWVMTPTGWESRTEEQIKHTAAAWLCTKSVRADIHKDPEPIRPSEANIRQFMFGLEIETTVGSLQMPCWLPATVERSGDTLIPRWAQSADVLHQGRDPNVGRPAPDWLLSFENGTLDMAALKDRRVELTPLDPCYFGGPSIPYALDVVMLQRLISLISDEEWGTEGWVAAQDAIIEACKEVAPVYMQSLCEQMSDHGVEHLADRVATMRSIIGDSMSWIRVWECVPLLIGKKRGGKDMTQFAIQAANGEASIVTVNNFDELDGEHAYAPFVGRKIAIIPDGHFDYETNRQAATKIKQLSGRGYVRIRDLYKSAIPNARLSTRLLIFLNNMPMMKDASMALATRFAPVFPFTRTFTGRTDDERKDKVLQEGSGIGLIGLLGFVEAWNRKPRAGLYHPKIAVDLRYVQRLINSSAPLKEFADKFCMVDVAAGPITMEDLYAAYRGASAEGKIDVAKPIGFNRFCDEVTHVCSLSLPRGSKREGEFMGIALNQAGLQLVQAGEDARAHRPPAKQWTPSAQLPLHQGAQPVRRDLDSDGPPAVDISDIPF